MSEAFTNIFGARTYNAGAAARSGGALFDEDFDRPPAPPPPPEPEVVEPAFSAAELETAREAAHREGRDAAQTEFECSAKAAAGKALADISAQIAAAREDAAAIAEDAAAAMARLLMDCFATSFPSLCARHGKAEAAAILREILPALRREPKISVRVNTHIAAEMTAEIDALDPDLAGKVRLIPTDAIAMGDVKIAWEHGDANRDTAALWRQIEDILAPAGLLTTETAKTNRTAKEPALVE